MCVENQYYFTYKITNTVKQKHYIGSKVSKLVPEDCIGVTYFSSSRDKKFLKDQQLNPENYVYDVVGIFDTYEEAIQHEVDLHEFYEVAKNKNFYNKSKQTSTGFSTYGMKFPTIDEVEKRKEATQSRIFIARIRKKAKLLLSLRKSQKNLHGNVGKCHTDETNQKNREARLGENNGMFGKKHTAETKRKMSKNNIGMLDKEHSTETKKLMSDSAKNRKACKIGVCSCCGWKGSMRIITRIHNSRCKQKSSKKDSKFVS